MCVAEHKKTLNTGAQAVARTHFQSPTCQTGKQQQHAPGWLTSLKDSPVLTTLGAEQQLLRGVGYLLLDIT